MKRYSSGFRVSSAEQPVVAHIDCRNCSGTQEECHKEMFMAAVDAAQIGCSAIVQPARTAGASASSDAAHHYAGSAEQPAMLNSLHERLVLQQDIGSARPISQPEKLLNPSSPPASPRRKLARLKASSRNAVLEQLLAEVRAIIGTATKPVDNHIEDWRPPAVVLANAQAVNSHPRDKYISLDEGRHVYVFTASSGARAEFPSL